MATSKEPIRLRQRQLKSGLVSLYLDIYFNGQRSYEYLNMYLVPEKTRTDKEKNRKLLALAEAIRSKRIVELRNGEYGFKNENSNADFLAFMENEKESHEKLRTLQTWNSALQHIRRYVGRDTFPCSGVTKQWVDGFKRYLATAQNNNYGDAHQLTQNSQRVYFAKLCAAVKRGMEEGIVAGNPLAGVESIDKAETERVFLTLDEIKAMAAEPCRNDAVKRSFLFSCLTGMRKSDVMKLRWRDVTENGEFVRVTFRQQKTGGQMYLDVPKHAAKYMGERGPNDGLVFGGWQYNNSTTSILREWAGRAGIRKDITFHSSRHTFAVLMLEIGTDIYTVKELLGHKGLQTTQIYAKVLDKSKQDAVSKIPDISKPDEE